VADDCKAAVTRLITSEAGQPDMCGSFAFSGDIFGMSYQAFAIAATFHGNQI
jgi:hypothetical protein